jgi:hypothetical protein
MIGDDEVQADLAGGPGRLDGGDTADNADDEINALISFF